MRIHLNERSLDISSGETLRQLAARLKPEADLLILNGFPVDGGLPLVEES
jgi:sulfur carrier protein ThiS adenylyltransferase